ncbi:hypothetical protein HZA97_00330 [Candidatus Woesearchaeota archaeon]|nr:hypothetical protein [Candidatus Woesearchaeota archaeon]
MKTINNSICALVASLAIGLGGCGIGPSTQIPEKTASNFPREKIFTVSARDYCDSIGKKLSDYKMVGVMGNNLSQYIPEGTEAIVDYDFDISGTQNMTWNYESGTALIPKKN